MTHMNINYNIFTMIKAKMLPNILSAQCPRVSTAFTHVNKYFSNFSINKTHALKIGSVIIETRTMNKQCEIHQRSSFSKTATNCQSVGSKEGTENIDKNPIGDKQKEKDEMTSCGKKPQIFGYNANRVGCGCDTTFNDGLKCGPQSGKTYQLAPKVTAGPVMRKVISTPLAPRPVAPYSQAVVADRMVYVSGCLGMNKETNKLVPGGIEEESRQALNCLGIILHESGSCFSNIVKTTVLLSDIKDFPVFNEVYRDFFEDERNFPARVAYQVAALPLGAKVEIDAIAITGDSSSGDEDKNGSIV